MGMFDDVKFELDCLKCGARVTGFQTKDREIPMMDMLDPLDLMHFYSSCDKCDAWIDVRRRRATSMEDFVITVDPKLEE